MLTIPVFGRLRQEDQEFKAFLSCIIRLSSPQNDKLESIIRKQLLGFRSFAISEAFTLYSYPLFLDQQRAIKTGLG